MELKKKLMQIKELFEMERVKKEETKREALMFFVLEKNEAEFVFTPPSGEARGVWGSPSLMKFDTEEEAKRFAKDRAVTGGVVYVLSVTSEFKNTGQVEERTPGKSS